MSNRADFTQATKVTLAKRVGYRCSFPGCPAITVGPSEESSSSTNDTGMACHIVAASDGPGARRVDAAMGPDEISSIDNGIWMCYRHGKMIDDDEAIYTVSLLKTWKKIAERKARVRHEAGGPVDFGPSVVEGIPLGESSVKLEGLGLENQLIGEALLQSGIDDVWGAELGYAVRDLAIEIARNAFQHGRASLFKIIIEPARVRLVDNGSPFPIEELLRHEGASGGAAAIRQLVDDHGNRAIVSSAREDDLNETVVALVFTPHDISLSTPCAVELEFRDLHDRGFEIPILERCNTNYIVMPIFISISDAFELVRRLGASAEAGRRFVIVSVGASAKVEEILRDGLPGCNLMNLKPDAV